jgi:hypothetical protein
VVQVVVLQEVVEAHPQVVEVVAEEVPLVEEDMACQQPHLH